MTARTVVVQLRGGLGNLLFGYAAGEALRREVGARVVYFPDRPDRPMARLERFLGTAVPRATNREIAAVGESRARSVVQRRIVDPSWWRVRRLGRNRLWLVDHPDSWAPRPALPPGPVVGLFGYYQHPSWYEPALPEVIARLQSGAPPDGSWQAPDAVVLNFRRGDFVQFGGDLPLAYYHRALAALGVGADAPLVMVADDQIFRELAAMYFRDRGYTVLDRAPAADPVLDDFWTMAGAGAVVMSNSTFCWWATVVGDARSPERRVVTPAAWHLGHGTALLRDRWERVASDRDA